MAKNFILKDSIYTLQKTDNPNNINKNEAYQQFIFEELPLDPAEIEGKELSPCFDNFVKDGERWS